MGIPFFQYMDDEDGIYICRTCGVCLSNPKMLMSKQFRGGTGPAYLFEEVINIKMSESEQRGMTTGKHIVRDINCSNCNLGLGWFYEMAFNPEQQYKEGHYILELAHIVLIPGIKEGSRRLSRTSTSTMGEIFSNFSYDDEKEDITV